MLTLSAVSFPVKQVWASDDVRLRPPAADRRRSFRYGERRGRSLALRVLALLMVTDEAKRVLILQSAAGAALHRICADDVSGPRT